MLIQRRHGRLLAGGNELQQPQVFGSGLLRQLRASGFRPARKL
jgi:hypothetical protein